MTTLTQNSIERIFKLDVGGDTLNLTDPNPELSDEEVKDLYSAQYPQLLNATINNLGLVDEKLVFEFQTVAGTKG